MRNQLFRFLVCFALICCILVNCSPIKSQATEVTVGVAGVGVLLWALLMSTGVVYEPTNDFLNQLDKEGQAIIGEALENLEEAQRVAAEDEFRRSVIDRMYFSEDPDFDDYDDGYEDDDVPDWGIKSGENNNLIMGVSLGACLAEWIYNVIQDGGFSVDGEVAPEGYAYYNGFCLPTFSGYDDYPYRIIFVDNSGNYRMVASSNPGWCQYSTSSDGETWVSVGTNIVYRFVLGDGVWSKDGAFYPYQYSISLRSGASTLIWSNHDLCFSDGSVFLAGSQPFSTYTETLIPSIYFGEVPDQVRDGTYDESDMPIPEVFNLQDIVKSASSSYSDLQQIYNQVYNGDMSYQDYMDQIQAEDSTGGSIVNPDSGNTGDSEDGSNEDSDNEVTKQLSDLTLDLSDYFPFCIPFDLYDFFACLNAEPEAPVISWEIPVPGGEPQELEIDLSVFDEVAQLLRRLQLLLFCVGLAFKTRDLIKG